ncbi:MAG: hypothetical protein ACK5LC_16280 [Coprobacillaceae bacterium]
MFKKLRNRFMLLIMVIITIVMLVSFSIIYIMTEKNMHYEDQKVLDGIVEKSILSSIDEGLAANETTEEASNQFSFSLNESDSGTSFVAEIYDLDSIDNMETGNDIEKAGYYDGIKYALENEEETTVTINNRSWMYKVTTLPINGSQITITNPYNFVIEDYPSIKETYKLVVFFEITSTSTNLNDLLYTLGAVGIVMLIVIFGISFYFSNKARIPIKKSWKKQRQFVADASHELKTPLSIIMSNYDVR